jgi:hypothetical protein
VARQRRSLRRLGAFQDLGAQFQPSGIIQIQDVDSGPTDGAEARNPGAFDGEVVGPLIAPRVKKPDDLSGLRVDSGQVRAFMKIAAVAGERQIVSIFEAAVLLRDDVLDMMPQFAMFLAQTAVFAPPVSPAPHDIPCCPVHLLLDDRVEVLTGLELED